MSAHRTNQPPGRYEGDPADIDPRLWRYLFARATGLTLRETRVLLFMSCEAEWEVDGTWRRREVCLGNARIADETGTTIRGLSGSDGVIASVIEKGWLTRVRPHTARHPVHYRLLVGAYRLAHYELADRDYH